MSEQPLINGIEYIPHDYISISDEEAAGPIAAAFAAVASVVSTVGSGVAAAAMSASAALTAGLTTITGSAALAGTLSGIIGHAAMGALVNAGVAYLGGARGGDVWRAAGMGAITAGVAQGAGAALNGVGTAATSVPGITANTAAVGPGLLLGKGAAGAISAGVSTAAVPVSSGIASGIHSLFGNIGNLDLSRIGAALVNAAVNGQSMGRLDGLVAQQRAELEALRVRDQAAYDQRISAAQQILADADKMDPAWHARLAMADVAGMEANEFRQAMRNIAARQGGSFDAGQAKAYERGASLHSARSKALAYNQRFSQAQAAQTQTRFQGAQLLGPNTAGFENLQAQNELALGAWDANRQLRESTWGGLTGAFLEHTNDAATSPDPSEGQGAPRRPRDPFSGGLDNPFGG